MQLRILSLDTVFSLYSCCTHKSIVISISKIESLIPPHFRIEKRDECEMVMLIGLPGCGKTTWVNKFIGENPDKKYDVIGTATLIEKMKVDGEPKKKHLEGKWDQLIQKSTRCLQDLLRTASQRRRNVIIDQVRYKTKTFLSH